MCGTTTDYFSVFSGGFRATFQKPVVGGGAKIAGECMDIPRLNTHIGTPCGMRFERLLESVWPCGFPLGCRYRFGLYTCFPPYRLKLIDTKFSLCKFRIHQPLHDTDLEYTDSLEYGFFEVQVLKMEMHTGIT